MDEPMQNVEKGAVISISITGGIVIVTLCAVIFYIFRELYCMDYYTNVMKAANVSRRSKKKKKKKKRKLSTISRTEQPEVSVSTIDVKQVTTLDRVTVAPGGRTIALPVPNSAPVDHHHIV